MFYNRKTTIEQVLRPYLKYLSEGKISLDGVGRTLLRLDTQNVFHLDTSSARS